MSTFVLVVAVSLWIAIGFLSLAYWWTREHDAHASDIAMFILGGLYLGPIALIFALIGFVESHENKIIIRRRNGKE